MRTLKLVLLVVTALSAVRAALAQSAGDSRPARVSITVLDETGSPVAGAQVTVSSNEKKWLTDTDVNGRAMLPVAENATQQIRVTKENFYVAVVSLAPTNGGSNLEVTLRHVRELHENVEVTDSPPEVDLAQTSASRRLTNREIFSLPYPTTRDFRQALPFIPQVVLDQNQQIHVAGAASYELFHSLDGFNITHPVSGTLDLRLSPDAIRLIDVQSSRYSAEYGKGSGGVLQIETGVGDDHFRYSATNFTPGLGFHNGVTFENATPRLVFSGPVLKGKAWWYEGLDGEYDSNVNRDLPSGRNANPLWRVDSISKVQVNLTPANILTGSFLINHEKDEHVGLSVFTPLQSTTDQHHEEFQASVKDSAYLSSKMLLETGVAVSEFHSDQLPRGSGASILNSVGAAGAFFETLGERARRVQGIGNLYLPPQHWHGEHAFSVGMDLDAIEYHQSQRRTPLSIFRADGTLDRTATFVAAPRFARSNFEASAYAQDRWTPAARMLVEYGLRADWDEIVRNALLSPRIAGAYLLSPAGTTKLSLGAGLVYDETNLNLVTRPLQGLRFDQMFAADGITPVGAPIRTSFTVDQRKLNEPRFLNWSATLERMLAHEVYLRLDFLEKRGRHGWDYVNTSANPALGGDFVLDNGKNDRYDSIALSAHKKLASNHELFASYAHSVARSNAILDFTVASPLFAQQAGGRLNWDAPNRFISWGWLPLPLWHNWLDFAYSVDWRTGFPFSVLNQNQQLIGAPNRLQFPDFFSLDLHLEHRFKLEGHEFALRLGVNNATGRKNPALVNNNIDSPNFLTFGAVQHRAFTARIRLLGRK